MINFEEHTDDEILIFKVLAGEADALELTSFEEKCSRDHAFGQLYVEMKNLWENSDALYKVQHVDADNAILTINTRIDKIEGRIRIRKLLTWGASIAAFLIFGIFAFQIFEVDTSIEIVTTNNVLNLVLPDSSEVTVNAHSKFVYPKEFNGGIRAVSLSGEAYFKVKKDKKKPFIITANKACIEVLGTEFNVCAKDKYTTVSVANGRVMLYSKSNKLKQVVLNGGDKGRFSIKDETVSKEPISETNFNSWATGVFKFDQTKLSEAVVLLEHYYLVKILIQDDAVANSKISATFNRDSLTSILQVMEATFNVKAVKKDSVILITNGAN